VMLPIVCCYLPESPEWLRVHCLCRDAPIMSREAQTSSDVPIRERCGNNDCAANEHVCIAINVTCMGITFYGIAAFFVVLANVPVVSMFAIFANTWFGLDAFHTGFLLTAAAIVNLSASTFVAPRMFRTMGDAWAGALSSCIICLGTFALVSDFLAISAVGLLTVYFGIAVSSNAVTCGAISLTDGTNRSTMMTGIRMLKSLGAVVGPVISSATAARDVRLPFCVTAVAALMAGGTQLLTLRGQRLLSDPSTKSILRDNNTIDDNKDPNDDRSDDDGDGYNTLLHV